MAPFSSNSANYFAASLPSEVVVRIVLFVPALRTVFALAATCKQLYARVAADNFVLAQWLLVHYSCASIHALHLLLKHPIHSSLLSMRPSVASLLLALDPCVSRYELQRMYRRVAFTSNNKLLLDCFSNHSMALYGTPIGPTVSYHKTPSNAAPLQPAPQTTTAAVTTTTNTATTSLPQQHQSPHDHPTLDDRRLLFIAADTGNTNALKSLLTHTSGLLLDPTVLADAYIRSWDAGDPYGYCIPKTGLLWPRCRESRWLVLERLVKEEEEVVGGVLVGQFGQQIVLFQQLASAQQQQQQQQQQFYHQRHEHEQNYHEYGQLPSLSMPQLSSSSSSLPSTISAYATLDEALAIAGEFEISDEIAESVMQNLRYIYEIIMDHVREEEEEKHVLVMRRSRRRSSIESLWNSSGVGEEEWGVNCVGGVVDDSSSSGSGINNNNNTNGSSSSRDAGVRTRASMDTVKGSFQTGEGSFMNVDERDDGFSSSASTTTDNIHNEYEIGSHSISSSSSSSSNTMSSTTLAMYNNNNINNSMISSSSSSNNLSVSVGTVKSMSNLLMSSGNCAYPGTPCIDATLVQVPRYVDILISSNALTHIINAQTVLEPSTIIPREDDAESQNEDISQIPATDMLKYLTTRVLKGRKPIYSNLRRSGSEGTGESRGNEVANKTYEQRVFDLATRVGSVRVAMMAVCCGRLRGGAGNVSVGVWHLRKWLERGWFGGIWMVVEVFGVSGCLGCEDGKVWEGIEGGEGEDEDEEVRRMSDGSLFGVPAVNAGAVDAAASLCWRYAILKGAVCVNWRWWKIVIGLGPLTVAGVLEASRVKGACVDVCREDYIGFRCGSDEVVRVLSKNVDMLYLQGCVLVAAARGDVVALGYVCRLGQILAGDLRGGNRKRVLEMLDAGAVIDDEGLIVAAGIAELHPGEWNDWPMAARCYRRVLVQRRLGLPVPSAGALARLPKTVVNTVFLAALYATQPIIHDSFAAITYSLFQRRRHANAAGVRINLVPVLERDLMVRIMGMAVEKIREIVRLHNNPAYPGESYCFIKGMLQYGLRDKSLLKEEDEFFLPDDEWEEVLAQLLQ